MAKKTSLTEQEKVAEILKKANVTFDPKKAQEVLALNQRCKRCGRQLNSLERITFEDKCAKCMTEQTSAKRDKFVKKYLIIAFAFVAMLVLGGYCANSSEKVWKIVGTVVSSIVIGVGMVYVLFTNMDKILPRVPVKAQTSLVFIVSLVADLALSYFIYYLNSTLLYVLCLLAIMAYFVYVAYGELVDIRQKTNLIDVYNRKSNDKEYIDEITQAIKERDSIRETEALNAEQDEENVDESAQVDVSDDDKSVTEQGEDALKQPEKPVAKKSKEPVEEDNGDWMI